MKHKKNPKIPNQNKTLKSNDNFKYFLKNREMYNATQINQTQKK